MLSNTTDFGTLLTFGSRNFFDWMDFLTAAFMLPFGGLLIAVFVGFVLPKSEVRAALSPAMGRGFELWYGVLRYIVPIALMIVSYNFV